MRLYGEVVRGVRRRSCCGEVGESAMSTLRGTTYGTEEYAMAFNQCDGDVVLDLGVSEAGTDTLYD